VLSRLGHALGIGQYRHPGPAGEWLEAEELLQRLLVSRSALLRMEADLVDPDGLLTVIDPEIGVPVEAPRRIPAEQQLLGQRPGQGGLAQALLTDQAVGVRQPAAGPLRLEEGARPRVTEHAVETETRSGVGRARASLACGHAAHLNKNLFDAAGCPHLS